MAVVLVTGGSSGIGLAAVRRLAGAGHRVFAASRHPQRAELPDGVTPMTLDVGAPDAATPAVEAVVQAAGRLDALVNNAGAGSIGPIEETTDEEAHRIFEVNLFGPMRLARAAIPVMRAQGGGRIVNVTSMNDTMPAPFGAWYSASKAALASASIVLDGEVHAFGITVSVVAPGLFKTAMAESLPTYGVPESSPYRAAIDGMRAQNEGRLGSAGDPDDVAGAIERCITDPQPPVRLVVGADAELMTKLVHDTPPDEFAEMVRRFVADLSRPSR